MGESRALPLAAGGCQPQSPRLGRGWSRGLPLLCGLSRLPSPGYPGDSRHPGLGIAQPPGPGWARSKRIPGREAPPSPRPGGRRHSPHLHPAPPRRTVDSGGRRRPRLRTDRPALHSRPLRSGAAGCAPASLTQRVGHIRQEADSLVPSQAEVRTGEMRPRSPCALFLLLQLLVASPAQLGAQVSAQLSVPRLSAGAQDLNHAPLERYGARLWFQRQARDPRPLDAPLAAPGPLLTVHPGPRGSGLRGGLPGV